MAWELANEAVDWASALDGRIVLGVTGPPGAGKSTLAHSIVDRGCSRMGEGWAAYLPMDGFHLSNSQLRRLGREQRKGAPDTFDVSGYVALLARVSKETESVIYAPDYDREAHEPIAARLAVLPHTQLVVTEGNYLALDEPGWREARTLIGQLWYVAADDALREERLIARQIAGGRTEDAARAWAEGTDRANGDLVKRTEKNCDRTVTPALR